MTRHERTLEEWRRDLFVVEKACRACHRLLQFVILLWWRAKIPRVHLSWKRKSSVSTENPFGRYFCPSMCDLPSRVADWQVISCQSAFFLSGQEYGYMIFQRNDVSCRVGDDDYNFTQEFLLMAIWRRLLNEINCLRLWLSWGVRPMVGCNMNNVFTLLVRLECLDVRLVVFKVISSWRFACI